MVEEYKDNEDFMEWATQVVGDPTSIVGLPIPSFPKIPSPIDKLGGALTLVPETIKETIIGKAKGEMSKVLGDAAKEKAEKEIEDLYKDLEASATPEEPTEATDGEANNGNTNENNENTNGSNGNTNGSDENTTNGNNESTNGNSGNGDDERQYPVGSLNRLNVNFLKLVTKHLIFTNTWNKFFEKEWRERGDKMKKAMVAYHKKICNRFKIFEAKYSALECVGICKLLKILSLR